MKAPLVVRLEASLGDTSDPLLKAELVAKIACYRARVGEFEEAQRARDELRRSFGDGRSASVSILIMLLEALLLYFKDLDRGARDRLVRANLLSLAFKQRQHVALTSAWLAHIDFNHGLYASMAKEIGKCLDAIDADDGNASCRVSLVLGDALLFADQGDSSRRWYDHARVTANRLGDQAAVGAITYNRAALHVASARLRCLSERLSPSVIALVAAEVRSAVNYQAVAQLSSLDHLLRSASTSVLMLEERYGEASASILSLLTSSSVPSGSSQLALLYADNAHCQARLGSYDLARQMAGAAAAASLNEFDADDRAKIFAALREFSLVIGDTTGASAYGIAQRQALDQHQAKIGEIRKLLEPYFSGPSV